jgi:hypothetical protein
MFRESGHLRAHFSAGGLDTARNTWFDAACSGDRLIRERIDLPI